MLTASAGLSRLSVQDPALAAMIEREEQRQATTLELIASENHVSPAIMEAVGSCLTNKYAEGYPGKRYYGGCQHVDEVEQLAIDRARELFNAEHANVQPHSGSQANAAVYLAMLQPNDTILSLDLAHGGHLTHGMKLNMSGMLYNVVHYGVEAASERLDMDRIADLARSCRPKLIITGASAYPRTLDFAAFASIAAEVGAHLLADIAHIAGLVAAGLHPSPIPHGAIVTTTTHKTLRGPRGGLILCKEEHAKTINSRVFPGTQGGPLMHVIAGKAAAFGEALRPEFRTYQQRILANAQALCAALSDAGLRIVSGGTDNHLMLVDLRPFDAELTGKQAEAWLEQAGIIVNKNMIPFDTRKPMLTSGLRLGTPALTTRGMQPPEMHTVAGLIVRALRSGGSDAELGHIRQEVRELCEQFALPH